MTAKTSYLRLLKQAKGKEAQNLGSTQAAQRQVKFTVPQFIKHIVDFIVADDQVNARL